MKKAILAVLLLLATTGRAGAQAYLPGTDSCLSSHFSFYANPYDSVHPPIGDSVLFDTCNSTIANSSLYARYVTITFDSNVINLPWAPADSILEVTWQAIDTSYMALRDSLQNLEQNIDSFILQKVYPDDTTSGNIGLRVFYLRFLGYGYYNELTLDTDLSSIPGISFHLPGPPNVVLDGVPESNPTSQNHLHLFPNPAAETIRINSDSNNAQGQISIIDARGMIVKSILVAQGSLDIEIDIHDLPSGSYSLRCTNDIIPFSHIK